MTVTDGGYNSGNFQAVEGERIEFDLAATNRSFLQLRAVDLPLTHNSMVYSADHSFDENAALHGVNYNDTVPINVTSGYYVQLDNWAAHSESGPRGPNTVAVYDSNTLSGSFHARATKISYEHDDLRIHNDRLRLINPSYSAKIKIVVDEKKARVTMFGGSDLIIQKALNQINNCIRDALTGGHRTIAPNFSKEEMNAILQSFGVNVEYIWIHPGESERFAKIVEKKVEGEVKKVTEYIVHAKLMGYHITGSPVTVSLIEESGIHLKKIQGRLPFAIKVNITSRVSSEGRVLFYIPENLVGKNESFVILRKNYTAIL